MKIKYTKVKSDSIIFASLLAFSPVATAQDGGIQFSNLLLTIAISLGLIASAYVFSLSQRMAGSALSKALLLYGAGMLSVVISLLSVTWLKAFIGSNAGFAHDGFFIIGFVLMVFGCRKVAGIL